ncbi:MAG: response regulator [Nanoarchaeota archaeon]|nr:response regulator [Nanoarchaeota archaeon]
MRMTPDKPGLHILIADDDHQSYYMRFQSEFRGRAYVSAVDDGDLAVKLFKEHNYDIVVLDFEMPYGGLRAAKEIRQQSKDVILVGYSLRWNDENSSQAGLNYFSSYENMVIDFLNLMIDALVIKD